MIMSNKLRFINYDSSKKEDCQANSKNGRRRLLLGKHLRCTNRRGDGGGQPADEREKVSL